MEKMKCTWAHVERIVNAELNDDVYESKKYCDGGCSFQKAHGCPQWDLMQIIESKIVSVENPERSFLDITVKLDDNTPGFQRTIKLERILSAVKAVAKGISVIAHTDDAKIEHTMIPRSVVKSLMKDGIAKLEAALYLHTTGKSWTAWVKKNADETRKWVDDFVAELKPID